MSGIFGINAVAQGQSAENIAADCHRTGGEMHLFINEARPALFVNDFARVIYRFKGTGIYNDDDILARNEAEVRQIVRVHHAQCPIGWLNFGNEPGLLHSDGTTNRAAVERLVQVTGWAQDEAEKLARKLVIFNTAVCHLKADMVSLLRPTIERAKRRGDRIGHHVYYHRTPFDAYNMQRGVWDWIDVQAALGGEWVISEWGYAHELHPHRGWRDYISSDVYRQHAKEAAARVFVPRGIPVMHFCRWNDQDHNWRTFDMRGEMDVVAQVNAGAVYTPPAEGTPLPAVVTWTSAKDGVNVRAEPRLNGKWLGTIKVGDTFGMFTPVRILISPTDSYHWIEIMLGGAPGGYEGGGGGTRAYIADEVFDWQMVDATETNLVMLDVPFVSQLDNDANLRNNDCGPVSALMCWQYRLQQKGVPIPRIVTMDRLIDATPLASADKPLTRLQVVDFLEGLGVKAALTNNLTMTVIRTEIRGGRPIIALVAYKHIVPADAFDGGHFLVVVGVSDQYVYVHDPYKGGANLRLPVAQFEQALADVVAVGAAGSPNLGILLVDAA